MIKTRRYSMEFHVESKSVLRVALKLTTRLYENNIRWKTEPTYKRHDRQGREVYTATITVIDSSGPGARRSHTGRKISAACWHVHGDLFDRIWALDPEAMIKTNLPKGTTMNGPEDNWQGGDTNIGSMVNPLWFRYACECE